MERYKQFGYNNVGQIGDNTATNRAELVYTLNNQRDGLLTGVVRIATGSHHTIALKEDKTAWIWGYNNYGQIGMNNTTNYKYPIPLKNVGNTDIMQNIKDISTGPTSSFVEDTQGNIYACGFNTSGQLSIGNATSVKIFTVAKDENGEPLTGVLTISNSTATTHGFAFEDGSVGVTGIGTSGQHGNLTLSNSNKITKIQGASIHTGNIYETYVNGTTNISVNITPVFNLNLDYEKTLKIGNITYTSLDEEIATVTNDGTITGVKEGTTGIKITDTTNEIETVAYVVVGKRDFSNISKIVAGDKQTALLKQDGTVWTWGGNEVGQLGDGEIYTKEATKPIQVLSPEGEGYLTNVVDIAAGTQSIIALKKDGTVVSWGANTYGQLGYGNGTAVRPVYVVDMYGIKLNGVIDVSATRDHAAVVKADGTVWTWGRNDYGQLGNNSTLATCPYAVQVLDSTGTDYLRDIKQVSVGHAYVAALAKDGTVWSWGLGTSGQLGNGAKTTKKLPVQATGVTQVTKVIAGNGTTTVLKEDGTVWGWGLNRYGTLGYGSASTTTSNANYAKTTQIQVKIDSTTNLENVKDIGGAFETKYALTQDGTVYGWGLNTTGEIGDYTKTNKSYATKTVRRYEAPLEQTIVKLMEDSASSYTSYMIRKDGSILANGRIANGQILEGGSYTEPRIYADDVLASYMEVVNRIEYLKEGTTKKLEIRAVENLNTFAKAPELGNLSFKSTNENVVSVDQNGNITAKQVGQATIIVTEDKHGYKAMARIYVTQNKQEAITAPMVVQGTGFTVVLKADGTVWASGLNTNGQLADGTYTNREKLAQIKIDEDTNLTNIVRIAAGASHVLALTKDGFVYSWGLNGNGQLGINSTTKANYAMQVVDQTGESNLENIIDIAAGVNHSIAITKEGNVYTWGKGGNYQLGNYATSNQTKPVRVWDTYNVVKASGGAEYTILLRADGVAQRNWIKYKWLARHGRCRH